MLCITFGVISTEKTLVQIQPVAFREGGVISKDFFPPGLASIMGLLPPSHLEGANKDVDRNDKSAR